MCSRIVVVGLWLCVAPVAHAAYLPESAGVPGAPDLPASQHPLAPGTPMTFLQVGDTAPAFSYLDPNGRWRSFDRLLERNAVVVLFGATDDDLAGMERLRPAFAEMGVVPVVVVDRRFGPAMKLGQQLSPGSTVISDARGAIASLFNSLDPLTHRHAPAFFVLDEARRVRAVGHGTIPHTLQIVAATARGLGKVLPESARMVSRHDTEAAR